jgi:hypothetical protein
VIACLIPSRSIAENLTVECAKTFKSLRDLPGPQPCLGREQHEDGVAQRVSGAAGKDEQITEIRGGKYFGSFAWHSCNIFVDVQQYTTATLLKQQRQQFSPRKRMTDKQKSICLSVLQNASRDSSDDQKNAARGLARRRTDRL